MSLVCLSRPLRPGLPAYNGQQDAFTVTHISDMKQGAATNSLRLSLNNHLGTHIDFPRHFFRDGRTWDDYPPEHFFFRRPLVGHVPLTEGRCLIVEDLKIIEADPEADLLLLKTDYGRFYELERYWNDNPGLGPEAAAWLKSRFPGLRALGVDFISINAHRNKDAGRAAHRLLLSPPEVLIIEDMNLEPLAGARPNWVLAAPLPVAGADGAPVTVLADLGV